MKKILMILVALFATQSALALAQHKGGDKERQITVGNENAAKHGATSDMKTVKDKDSADREDSHQAKGKADDENIATKDDSDGGHSGKKGNKDKKEHKAKKNKKEKAE